MQRLPHDEIRKAYSLLPQEDQVSNQAVIQLKRRLAEDFRTQLTFGAPTDEDEAGLRRLSSQLKSGKLVVKLFVSTHSMPSYISVSERIRLIPSLVILVQATSPSLAFPGKVN
jgi:hypothetical protein